MKIQNSISRPGCKLLAAAGVALMMAAAARGDYQSTVLSDNPIAFYALNPASDPSGTSPDLTGNGNNGTAVNITPANSHRLTLQMLQILTAGQLLT